MSQKSEDLLTVLDAGSSKIRVLVAELHEGALRYRAHSDVPAEGMRKGLISDLVEPLGTIATHHQRGGYRSGADGKCGHRQLRGRPGRYPRARC